MRIPFVRLTHNSELISLRGCAGLFLGSLLVGTVGYMLIEGYSFTESMYMSVITISTVGFGEVRPLSDAGRLFTSIYVVANLAITALFISQLTQHLISGGLISQIRQRIMVTEINNLIGHVVVCGAGRYGREILDQLIDTEETVVLVERDEERIGVTATAHPELLYVHGDATSDEILERAGVSRAKAMIVTLGSDSDNAFAVLTGRQRFAKTRHHRPYVQSREPSEDGTRRR